LRRGQKESAEERINKYHKKIYVIRRIQTIPGEVFGTGVSEAFKGQSEEIESKKNLKGYPLPQMLAQYGRKVEKDCLWKGSI